ncbi:hypothetical protein M3610_10565 [Neobacillus sp. MER 74]|uniref:hypothetical protein n=1 Tax=Neobacillus sp. MER 74 TaxID=2939566 RepID=UPI00203F9D31|nr:hypothetical protein [Neobacillus sp. MER 74]MCM3115731.1 hypothetical protein [Neobacillus sp. MER 74]
MRKLKYEEKQSQNFSTELIENVDTSLSWEDITKQRIERYEKILRVTKHSVKRKKILEHLNWLKTVIKVVQ